MLTLRVAHLLNQRRLFDVNFTRGRVGIEASALGPRDGGGVRARLRLALLKLSSRRLARFRARHLRAKALLRALLFRGDARCSLALFSSVQTASEGTSGRRSLKGVQYCTGWS
jgi:hypothetical protein